jgi:hypothetical protein
MRSAPPDAEPAGSSHAELRRRMLAGRPPAARQIPALLTPQPGTGGAGRPRACYAVATAAGNSPSRRITPGRPSTSHCPGDPAAGQPVMIAPVVITRPLASRKSGVLSPPGARQRPRASAPARQRDRIAVPARPGHPYRPVGNGARTAVQGALFPRILVARRDDVLGACDSAPQRRPPDRRRGWPRVDHPVPACLRGRCAIDPTRRPAPQLAEDTVLADETAASTIERLPDAPAPPPDLRSADSWAFPAPQFQQVREMLRVDDGWCLTRGRASTLVAG